MEGSGGGEGSSEKVHVKWALVYRREDGEGKGEVEGGGKWREGGHVAELSAVWQIRWW